MQNARQSTELKREKEIAIFDAACSVIREKGYHQARITDIAQRAGISYGLVYHYFKSKSDLFDAILKEWSDGLFSMMERFNERPVTVEEKLAAIVNYFLDQYEKRPDLVHIFITEFSRSSANMTPERIEMLRAFTRKTEDIIALGQNEKTLRDDIRPKYLMYVFLGAIEIFFSILVHENRPLKGRAQKQQFSQALMEVFLKGAKAA